MITAIRMNGAAKVKTGIENLPPKLRAELRKRTQALTLRAKAMAVASAPISPYGSRYKMPGSKKAVEMPAGYLRKTIKGKTRTYYQKSPMAIIGRVYSLLYVARFQEYGTAKMAGYSYLRSTLSKMRFEIYADLQMATEAVARSTF